MRKQPPQTGTGRPAAAIAAGERPRARISNQSEGSRAQVVKRAPASAGFRLTAHKLDDEPVQRQAELFYLQKQIQGQTQMIVVLEDGEKIEGCIEWFDRNVLKIRGRQKTLVYKSAIRYMYKQGDHGNATNPE